MKGWSGRERRALVLHLWLLTSVCSTGAHNQDLEVEGPAPFVGFPLCVHWSVFSLNSNLMATLLLKIPLECPWHG